MAGGELAAAGHSYFGTVNTIHDAQVILEASKQGLLPRVTRRLTDGERLRFVKAGACFCWEEEEAGIRRWTDHIKWSPSRVSGAFLTYSEVPARGDDTLIKQSFSSVDSQTNCKMHLIAYSSKAAHASGELPVPSQDPTLQKLFTTRRAVSPMKDELPVPSTSASTSSSSSSSDARSPSFNNPGLPSRFGRHPSFTSTTVSHRRSNSNLYDSARARPLSTSDPDRPRTGNSDPSNTRPPTAHEIATRPTRPEDYGLFHVSGPSSLPSTSSGSAPWPFAYSASSAPTGSGSWKDSLERGSSHTLPPPRSASWYEHRDSSPPYARSSSSNSSTPSLPGPSSRPSFTASNSSSLPTLNIAPPPSYPSGPDPVGGTAAHSSGTAGVSRQLAPYNILASGLPTIGDSPPASRYSPLRGTFLDDDDEDEHASNRGRGLEDERQLRLLGRDL